MTYIVSGGTLNPTHSLMAQNCQNLPTYTHIYSVLYQNTRFLCYDNYRWSDAVYLCVNY